MSVDGCLYLDIEPRPYTLQFPRQYDPYAVEIPIQFIWFDLDKATALERGQTEISRLVPAM